MRERISRVFADEPSFFHLLAAVAGLIAILKGLRTPYTWAATQAQLDYREGFLRRGLFGEICRQLHIPIANFGVFTVLSFVLLGICVAFLARTVWRSGMDRAGAGSLTALVAGSFCITYLVNLVGYLDVLMLLMVVGVLWLRKPWLQLVVAALFGIAGVLVHELYAVAFLPVSLVAPVCGWAQKRRPAQVVGIAFALLTPAALFLALTHAPEMTAQQACDLGHRIQARASFRIDMDMLTVFFESASQSRHYMLSLLHAETWWVVEIFGLLAFLPSTLFFLALAWRWATPYGRIAQGYLAAAVFAPLLLNFAGYDRYRWLMMMALNAIVCAMAVAWCRKRAGDAVATLDIKWRRAAVLLLAVNLATDVGFFLGPGESFPFEGYWDRHHMEMRHLDLRHLQPSDLSAQPWAALPIGTCPCLNSDGSPCTTPVAGGK